MSVAQSSSHERNNSSGSAIERGSGQHSDISRERQNSLRLLSAAPRLKFATVARVAPLALLLSCAVAVLCECSASPIAVGSALRAAPVCRPLFPQRHRGATRRGVRRAPRSCGNERDRGLRGTLRHADDRRAQSGRWRGFSTVHNGNRQCVMLIWRAASPVVVPTSPIPLRACGHRACAEKTSPCCASCALARCHPACVVRTEAERCAVTLIDATADPRRAERDGGCTAARCVEYLPLCGLASCIVSRSHRCLTPRLAAITGAEASALVVSLAPLARSPQGQAERSASVHRESMREATMRHSGCGTGSSAHVSHSL